MALVIRRSEEQALKLPSLAMSGHYDTGSVGIFK